MTWKSSCSIASDDESSRHSFLSDCDSEFDLRPPPRYPAEKRTLGRVEPPLTRSRSKAIGKPPPSPPVLPKNRRSTAQRRSLDSFANLTTTTTTTASQDKQLPQTSFLFSPPAETPTKDRLSNFFSDGVNILADRFENCSLDEEKINRNCVWPSRETNSRYMRPITSPANSFTFGPSPFSTPSSSSFSSLGQHQEQLWSRFRSAALELRNDPWSPTMVPTLSNPTPFAPATSQPTVSFPEPSSSLLRHRKIVTAVEPSSVPPIPTTNPDRSVSSYAFPKAVFTLTIFVIGLVLGYILTSTFPPSRLWQICLNGLRWIILSFETLVKYVQSLRSN